MFRCADNDALPFIFTFLFRFLNLIDDHWREEIKDENDDLLDDDAKSDTVTFHM